jgi:energy-coupling factor transporter ATP-binding protein EcfA2
MSVIEVHGLTKRFGPVLAVDQLSFDVGQAEVVGFLGANGAGKTTTLRMLLGLVRPDEGRALINGRPYQDLPEPLHQVGAVLEASGFHPGRTARDHLRIQALTGQADPSRIDEVRVALGVGTLVGHGAGLVVACALVAAIGAALGSLIRSQLAVVIGVFVWPLLIESLLGGLFDTIQPYLPYTAATTLAGIQLGVAAFGPAHNAATTASPLPFAAATALLAVLAAVVAAVAARTTVARDVT